MNSFRSNDEFHAALRTLVERWCDERRLDALARLLPAYLAFNGLTDGWGDLSSALKAVRGLGPRSFNEVDWDTLNELVGAADLVLGER